MQTNNMYNDTNSHYLNVSDRQHDHGQRIEEKEKKTTTNRKKITDNNNRQPNKKPKEQKKIK